MEDAKKYSSMNIRFISNLYHCTVFFYFNQGEGGKVPRKTHERLTKSKLITAFFKNQKPYM